MNFPRPSDPWSRLTAAARQAGGPESEGAPYGFATRVVALAWAQERRMASLWERFASRALLIAAGVALGSVALNWGSFSRPEGRATAAAPVSSVDNFDVLAHDNSLAVVLDLTD